MTNEFAGLRLAVVIPCYNEAIAIPEVVRGFRKALPAAEIYVYDNNSSDNTAQVAAGEGAIVGFEPFRGKGYVMRRMFSDIEADIYILVDGDDTYDASAAPLMIRELLDGQLDMVNGARITDMKEAYRFGHRFGNRLLTGLVTSIFGKEFTDMLSGFRVLSRRFVKSFPALSSGFEIETELTVHALELRMKTAEVPTRYRSRPEGSRSKLNTIRDGVRILRTIGILIKEERPMMFFSIISLLLATLSVAISVPVISEYMRTGLVPRFPTAILSASIMLLAFLSAACGLILDTVTHSRRELKRLAYLAIAAPCWPAKSKAIVQPRNIMGRESDPTVQAARIG